MEETTIKSEALKQIEREKESINNLVDALVGKKYWWDDLEIIDEPYPHIPESKILAAMPEELKQQWEEFIRGQTCLAINMDDHDKRDSGIYPWDFARFTSKLKRGLPTQDTTEEWD